MDLPSKTNDQANSRKLQSQPQETALVVSERAGDVPVWMPRRPGKIKMRMASHTDVPQHAGRHRCGEQG